MNNLIFGILSVLLSGIGYFFSWKFQRKRNYKMVIVLLLFSGLVLMIYVSMDSYLHVWDEQYHALVAKHMITHPFIPTLYENPVFSYNYKNWTANHIWLHKQPLPLWVMALSMRLFGVNAFALRLPSIILTTIGIWLTFFIGRFFFNKKVGYLAAFFFSLNGLIIELTGGRVATDHIDIFFLFFIELAVFFSICFVLRKKTIFNFFVGISIGAAILSKWLPALIVLPIWLFIVIDSKQFNVKTILLQFLLLCVTCIIVFLPWQLYIYKNFPIEAAWEASFNFKHLTTILEGNGGRFYYFLDKIRINYGELIYLPLLWFLWKSLRKPFSYKKMALLIWFWIPLLFFSFAKTKMQAYLLFTAPALFLMTAAFFYMVSDYKKTHKPKWLYTLILVLFILLPVRYAIERIKPFQKRERNPVCVRNLKKLNTKCIKKGILFNYQNPVEAMFYTSLNVYPFVPSLNDISALKSRGYSIIINDNGNIPESYKSIKGIIIVKIN